MKGEDTLDGRCVRAMIGARIRLLHGDERRHLKRRCVGHNMSPVHNNPKADVMARYEWTGV